MPSTRNWYVPAVLTVVFAGLGHLSLGRWRRGATWMAVYALALLFFSASAPLLAGGDATGPFVVTVLSGELHPAGAAFPLSILVLCLVDLYAKRRFGSVRTEPAEPNG